MAPADPKKRKIGFLVEEKAAAYGPTVIAAPLAGARGRTEATGDLMIEHAIKSVV
jgi:hypothetical protein